MKILTIIGARPQFIKAAIVSKHLTKDFEEIIVHTGQHYDQNMSEIFFKELEIAKPDYNLNVGSGTHGVQTGNMLIKIEQILIKEKPDCVVIYGDTNSTIAGCLASTKLHIPVAHVEAGLRSFNKKMPEEQNRISADHLSNLLFAPTQTGVNNLYAEGLKENVYNVGDVMYDAILYFAQLASIKSNVIKNLNLNKKYILATIHRAENTDNEKRLKNIFAALNECGKYVVLPLHPRTKKYIEKYGIKLNENIKIIEPVGYLDMIELMKNSNKIITDSGGVQKEAFFLGKPCITVRDETEWIETVNNNWNMVAGCDVDKILYGLNEFLPTQERENYFGDGKAAKKICDILKQNLSHNILKEN